MNAFERKVKIIKELIRFNKNPVFFHIGHYTFVVSGILKGVP